MIGKKEARAMAKEVVQDAIASAYYKLEGMMYDHLTDEEKELVIKYVNQYGETACKAFGVRYYTN